MKEAAERILYLRLKNVSHTKTPTPEVKVFDRARREGQSWEFRGKGRLCFHASDWLPSVTLPAFLAQGAEAPPKTWIDPDTGHRVVRLTDEPNSASLYFNQNGYTADGRKMVYTTPDGISALDLETHTRKERGERARAGDRHRAQDAERLLPQGR